MEIDELKEWLKERISALDGPLVQNGDLVRAKTYAEVLSKITTLKTVGGAFEIWSRMNSLWATTPALEAIKEMTRLLIKEGWVRQVTEEIPEQPTAHPQTAPS